MIIKNSGEEELEEALQKLNEKYEDNIRFRNFQRVGRRHKLTFTIVDTHKKGAKFSQYYLENKLLNRSNKGIIKHTSNACWHVYGDFFDILLKINPNAIIISQYIHERTVYSKNSRIFGNWQDFSMGVLYESQLCECEK